MPGATYTLQDRKAALRADLHLKRAAAHAARGATAGDALATRFLDRFGTGIGGRTVSAYWPMRDEIDVRMLLMALSAQSVRTALPVMIGSDRPLNFRSWQSGDPLVEAIFGVSEPGPDTDTVVPDIVIVPLLGFDAAGNRLGYGGGYYDRTLASLRAAGDVIAVGVGYDEQECGNVPVHAGDAPLDVVLTDKRTIVPGEQGNQN